MCGICGSFDLSGAPADRDVLSRMTGALRHRGPDGDGLLIDGEVALGHRRLSIIDLDGGRQPLGNEDGRLQVVFNGEIYNFVELTRELEKQGHQFRTRSDTEVIVHAYEEWGAGCVTHFNGMFSFALWDSERHELLVARDHLGIKPLYYVQLGSRILFASEIKALLVDPACPRELDPEALAELFTFRYVPSPKTLFREIRKLPPGHLLRVSARGLEVTRFWTSIPTEVSERPENELIEEYQSLLEDAVRLQLRSDVPLGLFLSSGVDSAGLLAIMAEHSPSPIRSFTIGFEGGHLTNEVEDARKVAERFGAYHEFMMVGPDDYMRYYDRYLWDLEEPVGNETAAAFYFVSQLTSRHVKVALTGQGADEPWAGYDRYRGAQLSAYYSRLPVPITAGLAQVLSRIPGRFERLSRGALALGERDVLTRFAKVYSFFSAEMKERLFNTALKERLSPDPYQARAALQRIQCDVAGRDPLSQMLYIDTRSNLPDDLLMVADKTAMANSLEARVPYLDYRLVEFVERLPTRLKLKRGRAKYLHKRALEKWLPKDVVWRKKRGFANPVEHWFRVQMRPFVEECLLSGDSASRQYFDQEYIAEMLRLDREGTRQYRRHLYLLVSFELWHRQFLRAPVS